MRAHAHTHAQVSAHTPPRRFESWHASSWMMAPCACSSTTNSGVWVGYEEGAHPPAAGYEGRLQEKRTKSDGFVMKAEGGGGGRQTGKKQKNKK